MFVVNVAVYHFVRNSDGCKNANFYTHNLKIKFDLTLPRPAQNCIHWPYKQDQKQILQVFYIQGIIPDFVLIINYSLLLVCLFLLLVLHNIQHLGRPEIKLTWFYIYQQKSYQPLNNITVLAIARNVLLEIIPLSQVQSLLPM